MVIVFALLAALSNAVNEATQHIASTAAPRQSSGRRLVVYLFRSPLWLFGWVALVAAFVFQALALHNGQISVVQPLPGRMGPMPAGSTLGCLAWRLLTRRGTGGKRNWQRRPKGRNQRAPCDGKPGEGGRRGR